MKLPLGRQNVLFLGLDNGTGNPEGFEIALSFLIAAGARWRYQFTAFNEARRCNLLAIH